jgi:hypothetical protein
MINENDKNEKQKYLLPDKLNETFLYDILFITCFLWTEKLFSII